MALMWRAVFTLDGSRHAPSLRGAAPQNGAAALDVSAGLTFESHSCVEGKGRGVENKQRVRSEVQNTES